MLYIWYLPKKDNFSFYLLLLWVLRFRLNALQAKTQQNEIRQMIACGRINVSSYINCALQFKKEKNQRHNI